VTSRPQSQCLVCAHRQQPRDDGTQVCTAYLNGIPLAIQRNHVDHRQAQPGDHGVRWRSAIGMPFPEWAMTGQPPNPAPPVKAR
jgi:hypothetical protein